MLKQIICLLIVSGLSFGSCFAQDFPDVLREGGFDVSILQQQSSVSRYQLARYVDALSCSDCFYPSDELVAKYDASWLTTVQNNQQYNIADISFDNTIYQGDDYFMCVALAVDRGLLGGYPQGTSPYCRGSFCGSNVATYDTLLHSLYQLLRINIYQEFSLNWDQVSGRYKGNIPDYPIERAGLISASLANCPSGECPLNSPSALDIYISYCGENPNATECSFVRYDAFMQTPELLSIVNVLIDLEIVSRSSIANISSPYMTFDGATLLDRASQVYPFMGCQLDNDLDNDGIVNVRDGCYNVCNPHQSDTDNDGIGDSCDDDIDNDGVLNQIGVVDAFGGINSELLSQSNDNCVFVYNPDQENRSGGIFGDACDPKLSANITNALIQASTYSGETNNSISFSLISSGKIESVVWELGDGTSAQGVNISHTYRNPGLYIVQSTVTFSNGQIATAKVTIDIIPSIDDFVACEGFFDPVQASAPANITLSHRIAGPISQVTRQHDTEVLGNISSGEELSVRLDQAGRYRIDMQCYDQEGDRVGLSQMFLEVADQSANSIGSYLQANPLRVPIGDTIRFETITAGIDITTIDRIVRDMGDGPSFESNQLSLLKRYDLPGSYVVGQTVFFNNGMRPLQHATTISVLPISVPKLLTMSIDRAVVSPGELVNMNASVDGFLLTDIDQVSWSCDGEMRHVSQIDASSFSHVCRFNQGGPKNITVRIFSNGMALTHTTTIFVEHLPGCGENINQLSCDYDDDGFPDLCDADIDGDEIPNLNGLILQEIENCSLPGGNPMVEKGMMLCSTGYDNCPFVPNLDQIDTDGDGIGDACDPIENTTLPDLSLTGDGLFDADGDGIPNDQDACPEIPESRNGILDADGCPEPQSLLQEMGPENNINNGDSNGWIDAGGGDGSAGDGGDGSDNTGPFVSVSDCEQCPCPFADFASEIRKGDRVRAVLLDEAGKIIYEYSETEFIDKDVTELLD